MPGAFVLLYEAIKRPSPIWLRAWLYKQLGTLGRSVHASQGPKPFAIAIKENSDGFWIRFSFSKDEVYEAALNRAWEFLYRSPFEKSPEGRITAVFETAHELSGKKSWAELMAAAPSADLPLEFQSPTFFRRRDANYPIPSPGLILASLIRDWNAFAPEPVPPEVAERLVEYTTARHLNVRTVSVTAHSRTPGFVGRVTLHLPRATEEEARWLSRLGELAFFSGVGAKTTLGFGLVRRYELDGQGAKGAHPDGGAGSRSADRKP